MIIDTRITIETPEGAELPLNPAGIGPRIGAFLIDLLIRFAVSLAIIIVLSLAMGDASGGLILIFYFLITWFYMVFFEVWRNGQTPGKKHMNITVVNDDGTPVTFAGSLLRNLLRVVDTLPFAYAVGVISATCNLQFKRLGDIAAGTMVVHVFASTDIPELDIKDKRPMPSDFTTDEQRALLNFAERAPQLSDERQAELAAILAPLIGRNDTVNTIKKMANSTLSGR